MESARRAMLRHPLTTTATFVTKIFTHQSNVPGPEWQIPFRTSVVNTDVAASRKCFVTAVGATDAAKENATINIQHR